MSALGMDTKKSMRGLRSAPHLSSGHERRSVAALVFQLKLPGCSVTQGWVEVLFVIVGDPGLECPAQLEGTGPLVQPQIRLLRGRIGRSASALPSSEAPALRSWVAQGCRSEWGEWTLGIPAIV